MVLTTVGFGISTLIQNTGQSNNLIDVSKYNLKTMNGQVSFAKAVSATQAFNAGSDRLNYIFATAGIICVIGSDVFTFHKMTRPKITSNIVLYSETMQEVESSESNPGDTHV
jgi:hypothetical protein